MGRIGTALAPHLRLVLACRARWREQWFEPESLRRLRIERLRRLAVIAVRAPFYREAFERIGMRPDDLADEEALKRLPVLERSYLVGQSRDDFLTAVDPTGLFPIQTSGSSGKPVMVWRGPRDQADASALWVRTQRAYGRRAWHRQVNIGSGRAAAQKGPSAALQRLGIVPAIVNVSSFAAPEEVISVLQRVRPQVITGYAVALEQLATAMLDAGQSAPRPLVIISGGMELTERAHELIERVFGAPVRDAYVAHETGPIAFECPDAPGVLHLNDDVQVVEIVDEEGRRLPDGEVGEVVVTPLFLTTMPLLRYRLGDLAARLPTARCPCGRGLARLSRVQGRSTHVVRAPDGRSALNGVMAGWIVKQHDGVRRYQVRQVAPDRLEIAVVPGHGWTAESAVALARDFGAKLDGAFAAEVVVCDDIPLAPGGKFQTIVPMREPGGP